jgi:DDE superfamily endonuclease
MTESELQGVSPALAKYLDRYMFCCHSTQTFAHLGTYVRGLLSDLERKTCEPIALKAGTPPRTLQEFLRDHVWSYQQVREQHYDHVAALLPRLPNDDLGIVGFIDETSAAKSGNKTPGVARQYLGCVALLLSTSASAKLPSRPFSTPSCICPRSGMRIANGAAPLAFPTRWCTAPSGGSLWKNSTGPRQRASAWTG